MSINPRPGHRVAVAPPCRDAPRGTPWGVSEAGTISPSRTSLRGAPSLRSKVSPVDHPCPSRRRPTGRLYIGGLALVLALLPGISQAATVELSSGMAPIPDSYGTSSQPAWSADGRYVAFLSDAPNLVPGQEDGNYGT